MPGADAGWPESVITPLGAGAKTVRLVEEDSSPQDQLDESGWIAPDEALEAELADYEQEHPVEDAGPQEIAQQEAAVITLEEQNPPQDQPVISLEEQHNWQVIWGPFNSQVSAEGFAQRLSRVTGLIFNAIEKRPGRYVVAVAYDDDADRIASLAAISAKTGLNLKGLQQ